MYRGEIWIQEQNARRARDERSHIHQHLQAMSEARREAGASSPMRRRLGGSIIRLGHRVAGGQLGSPALTS